MKKALLIIDIQKWFFKIPYFSTQEGKKKLEELITNTNILIDEFKKRNYPIIHILTVHKKDGSTRDNRSKKNNSWVLIEGSDDAKELSDIHKHNTDIQVIKTRTDSFLNTNLAKILKQKNIKDIIITGYSVNKCVGITAISGCERDFEVVLAKEAILGSKDNENKIKAMLKILESYGLILQTNQEIIEQL